VRLKSLRLFGFKTFAEQTTITFEPGITGIVGPNGSGKSNIVDAIRWALGEHSAKSLRSSKTEDVIFAGNERRKPLGMAEVSVTFDNSERLLPIDALEVQITRRAYRTGESEYYINREHVRMRDVVDLLSGTGLGPGSYAIVSQGQIDAILSSKPSERRSLFEEAAGIGRFLARKAESLRRLEATEQNAIRISDLLAELEKRLPELDGQVRRAERYKKATARLRDVEILSYLRAGSSRRAEREALQRELEGVDADRADLSARLARLDAEHNAARSQLYTSELELDNTREALTGLRAQSAELETLHAAAVARKAALDSSSRADDRERVESERHSLDETIARLEGEIAPLRGAIDEHRERERNAQEALAAARLALDRVFGELRELEAAATAEAAADARRRAELEAAQHEYERLEAESNRLREEAHAKGEAAAGRAHEIEQAEAAVVEVEARLAQAHRDVERIDEAIDEVARGMSQTQERLRAHTTEFAGAQARLHTIEELEANLEGHVPGTRAVIEARQRREIGGVVGVVADLVRVDEKYTRALDVAFGAGLSNIVVETAEDAESAISYLKARELGRATFLPLDVLSSRTGRASAPAQSGVIGYAHTLVETDPRYAGVVAFLVGRVLVVETLEAGVRLVRGRSAADSFRDTIVTLEGDQILGGGAMTGGRYKRERSILSRRAQARSLSESLPRLSAAIAALEEELETISRRRAEIAAQRDAARKDLAEHESALRDQRARIETLRAERARLDAEITGLLQRSQDAEEGSAAARRRLSELERPSEAPAIAQADRDRLDEALAAARETIARAQDAERAIAAEIGALRETFASLTAQCDAARSRREMIDADSERAEAAREALERELAELTARITDLERDLGLARAQVEQTGEALRVRREERDALAARSVELEEQLRQAHDRERESAQRGDAARLRLAEIDAELGMLAAQFAQNPATAQDCAEVEERYASFEGDASADVVRLRDEIARLSNVNLNAEAERAELHERRAFLTTQLADLSKARETLLDGVREIELTSQQQFNATFEALSAAFTDVFSTMFPAGEAKMWQTDPDRPSETGIELAVRPPGKKMMSLSALSGGERAMTAAALIFALIKIKPSPFYLLDECDAALDDANVDRFSTMVRSIADEAQMLLVTHNKRTMELARRLYGVTMAEPGISSIISAALTQDEAQEREPSGPQAAIAS
jgi:chromosome segregation protein